MNASAEQAKMMTLARTHLMGGVAAAAEPAAAFAVPNAPAPSAAFAGTGSRLLAPGAGGFGLPTRPSPPSSLVTLGAGAGAAATGAVRRSGVPVAGTGASGLLQPRTVQQTALGLANGTHRLSALNGPLPLASHMTAVSTLAQYPKPAHAAGAYVPATAANEAAPVAWDDECY